MAQQLAIEADDPRRVAMVLARLWGGTAQAAGPTWQATAGDDEEAIVEVRPRSQGEDRARGRLAMGTLLDPGAVLAIAAREGWPATSRRCAGFAVVEIWIEHRRLIEVVTADVGSGLERALAAPGWKRMLSSDELSA